MGIRKVGISFYVVALFNATEDFLAVFYQKLESFNTALQLFPDILENRLGLMSLLKETLRGKILAKDAASSEN